MKMLLVSALFLSSLCLFAEEGKDNISKEMCIKLVEQTCKDLQGAADDKTIMDKITNGDAPYKDATNKELYVFLYDEKVNITAHPTKDLVGKNYDKKPDTRGKNFRNLIVEGAMKNGTGWVNYTYQKPGSTGEFRKEAYYMKCQLKSKVHIVISGRYEN